MGIENKLQGWVEGPPERRDDGSLAIVQLVDEVKVDGQEHYSLPIIVSRWSNKLKTTGCAHRLEYENVLRHIDIAS